MRNAPIAQEELFGPVALLFRVASLDEAIALANDTPFGLAASAWTTDDAERQRLAAELQAGAVFFNTLVASATPASPSAASSAPATAANSPPSACASSSTPKP
jgi:acyl-CoA reductase-like NAD-dependent aldehyde dehydrogenase